MVIMIWAQDQNKGIGLNNKLPWQIKEEMSHFRSTTLDKIVVMGRKTFESIGRPLPHRKNIIISKNSNLSIAGAEVYADIATVVAKYKNQDMYVIGGKSIYEAFLPYAQRLIVSQIPKSYNCDTFMDKIDFSKFKLSSADKSHTEFIINYYDKL